MATTVVSTGTDLNLKVLEQPWWKLIVIRTARSYLQSLLGLFGAYSIGVVGLHDVYLVFAAAGFPALISLLQNSLEVLNGLDSNDKYATYRA